MSGIQMRCSDVFGTQATADAKGCGRFSLLGPVRSHVLGSALTLYAAAY